MNHAILELQALQRIAQKYWSNNTLIKENNILLISLSTEWNMFIYKINIFNFISHIGFTFLTELIKFCILLRTHVMLFLDHPSASY